MVRMAIALMLFQFLSPAFIPLVVQEIPTEKATAYHAQHSSIVAPTFLKEKDEKEDSNIFTVSGLAAILDFNSHSFNLAVSHNNKYSKFAEASAIIQPPRFALFCTLLIWFIHLLMSDANPLRAGHCWGFPYPERTQSLILYENRRGALTETPVTSCTKYLINWWPQYQRNAE